MIQGVENRGIACKNQGTGGIQNQKTGGTAVMGMFAAGMMIGGTIAIILMAMCQVAGAADEAEEKMMEEEE